MSAPADTAQFVKIALAVYKRKVLRMSVFEFQHDFKIMYRVLWSNAAVSEPLHPKHVYLTFAVQRIIYVTVIKNWSITFFKLGNTKGSDLLNNSTVRPGPI